MTIREHAYALAPHLTRACGVLLCSIGLCSPAHAHGGAFVGYIAASWLTWLVCFVIALATTRSWKVPLALVLLFGGYQALLTQTALGDTNPFRLSGASLVVHLLAFALPVLVTTVFAVRPFLKRKRVAGV